MQSSHSVYTSSLLSKLVVKFFSSYRYLPSGYTSCTEYFVDGMPCLLFPQYLHFCQIQFSKFLADYTSKLIEEHVCLQADLVSEEKAKRRKEMLEGRPVAKTALEEAQEEDWANMANGLHNMQPTGSANN